MRLFRDPTFSVMKETVFVCSLASMHVGFRVGIGKQETTFIRPKAYERHIKIGIRFGLIFLFQNTTRDVLTGIEMGY